MTNDVRQSFSAFRASEQFRAYPLQLRIIFEKVAGWFPEAAAALNMIELDARFARRLRDKASRERGYKFGNNLLALLQILVKNEIANGNLSSNKIRNVPKLRPMALARGFRRRHIQPIRRPIGSPTDALSKTESGR